MTFLAGILTIRDAIIAGAPVAESILSILPICDKIYINDAGSTDGTREIFQRMKSIWPARIELLQIPDSDYVSQHFELVDDVINESILPLIDSEWIALLEGDTLWHEKSLMNIFDLMKNTEYNSIRQPAWDTQWCSKNAFKDFSNVRIARNLPGVTICDGAMGFCLNGVRAGNGKDTTVGLLPELKVEYPRFHFPYLFPGNAIERARRHAEHLEIANVRRKEHYEQIKKRFGGELFQKRNIPSSSNLPALIRGLAGEPVYFVRDELFDIDWLKETTGLDYGSR